MFKKPPLDPDSLETCWEFQSFFCCEDYWEGGKVPVAEGPGRNLIIWAFSAGCQARVLYWEHIVCFCQWSVNNQDCVTFLILLDLSTVFRTTDHGIVLDHVWKLRVGSECYSSCPFPRASSGCCWWERRIEARRCYTAGTCRAQLFPLFFYWCTKPLWEVTYWNGVR